jgi:hypothetical protein
LKEEEGQSVGGTLSSDPLVEVPRQATDAALQLQLHEVGKEFRHIPSEQMSQFVDMASLS